MFIDEKLNEMHLEILKEDKLTNHLIKIDQELHECIILKKQLQQALETIDEWKHAHKFSFLRLFHQSKRHDYTRKQVSDKEKREITHELEAIQARINHLLDEAQTIDHRVQEIMNLVTDYEILITEKIDRIHDHPYIDEIKDLDNMIKLQLDNFKRNDIILSMGSRLRNDLIQYRQSNNLDNSEWDFEFEESSLYQFHQMLQIEDESITLESLSKHTQEFKSEIQNHHLYLPYTLEDVLQKKRFRKPKERIIISWYETYDALNRILDHFWEMNRTIKRRILDLYQHRHSKVVYKTIEEGVINR